MDFLPSTIYYSKLVVDSTVLYTYLNFCIAGSNGEVLSSPVPLQRGHIEGVWLKLTKIVDASFLCVEEVDRSTQSNSQLVTSAPVKNIEIYRHTVLFIP